MSILNSFTATCMLPICLLYALVSLLVFNKVFDTSTCVIDELFHLRQGLAYCGLNFTNWDPKITTLPGLYLYSTGFCNLFGTCSIYCLRLSTLVASVYNLLLFYLIKQLIEPKGSKHLHAFSALNLATLPPLYFFSHVYYTDIPGLTCVLGIYYYGVQRKYIIASIFGVAAVLMRQTNIIYVALIAGLIVIGSIFNALYNPKKFNKGDLSIQIEDVTRLRKSSKRFNLKTCIKSVPLIEVSFYANIAIAFVLFIILNGSIVVGDKTAHTPVLHIPQIFYFTLFCVVFAWPHCVNEIKPFILKSRRFWPLFIAITLVLCAIIRFNTIVHPYLLADNRHYIFYVWKRIFENTLLRYAMSPLYIFGFYCMWNKLYDPKDIRFSVLFIPIVVFVLFLQRLLEIRYFLVPYALLRLQFRNVSKAVLVCEFFTYFIVNSFAFYVFFTKEIMWVDFKEAQRLIW